MLKENAKILKSLSNSLAKLGYDRLSGKVASLTKIATVEVEVDSGSLSGLDEVWNTLVENPNETVKMNWNNSIYDNHLIKWNKDRTDLLWTEDEWHGYNAQFESVLKAQSSDYTKVYSDLKRRLNEWNDKGGYMASLTSEQKGKAGVYSNGSVTYVLSSDGLVTKNGEEMSPSDSVRWRLRNLSEEGVFHDSNFKLLPTEEQEQEAARAEREEQAAARALTDDQWVKGIKSYGFNKFYDQMYFKGYNTVFAFVEPSDEETFPGEIDYIRDLSSYRDDQGPVSITDNDQIKYILNAIFKANIRTDRFDSEEIVTLTLKRDVTPRLIPSSPPAPQPVQQPAPQTVQQPAPQPAAPADDSLLSNASSNKRKRKNRLNKMAGRVVIAGPLAGVTSQQIQAVAPQSGNTGSTGNTGSSGTGAVGSKAPGPWITVQDLMRSLNHVSGAGLDLGDRTYRDGYWGKNTAKMYNELTGESESDSLSNGDIGRIEKTLREKISEHQGQAPREEAPEEARKQPIDSDMQRLLIIYANYDGDAELVRNREALKDDPFWKEWFNHPKSPRFHEHIFVKYPEKGEELKKVYERDDNASNGRLELLLRNYTITTNFSEAQLRNYYYVAESDVKGVKYILQKKTGVTLHPDLPNADFAFTMVNGNGKVIDLRERDKLGLPDQITNSERRRLRRARREDRKSLPDRDDRSTRRKADRRAVRDYQQRQRVRSERRRERLENRRGNRS